MLPHSSQHRLRQKRDIRRDPIDRAPYFGKRCFREKREKCRPSLMVLAAPQDARLFNRPPGSSCRSPKARRRDLLIYPALISLGASLLAACTGQWPYLPSQASAAWPLASLPPPSRPIRKHKPPPATDALATDAGVEALAKAEPAATMPASFSPPDAPATGPAAPQASELIGLDPPEATRLLGATGSNSRNHPLWSGDTRTPRASSTCSFISTCAATGCGRCTMW